LFTRTAGPLLLHEVVMANQPSLSTSDIQTMRDQVRVAWETAFPDTEVPRSLLATDRAIESVVLAERQFTGLLVALWVDPEQAVQLAVPGGEAPESLHLTLAYVADSADADDVTFARIVTALADVAALQSLISGKVGGAGCFYGSDSSDGRDVYYAVPDVPDLDFFREQVVRAMGQAGVFVGGGDHAYTPHITLAYGGAGADIPMPPRIDLTFTGLTIVAGERRITIPFWQSQGVEYLGAFPESLDYYAEKAQLKPQSGRASDSWRFSSRRTFAAGDQWIQVLPPPGTYHHTLYGTLDFTGQKYDQILANFHAGVYAQTLPVNAEHDLMTSGAVGWVTDMRRGPDGSIEVRTDWNERGRALIDQDQFRYVSAEWFNRWQDPVSGQWIDNVFSGFAICKRPHFKTDVLRPLAASEVEAFRAGEPGKEMNGMTNAAETQTPPVDAAIHLSEQELADFRAFREAGGTAKLTELSEAVTKLQDDKKALETDARRKRFTDIARGRAEGADGVAWSGQVEDHVAMLTDLATAFGDDSEQVTRYISTQTAQATAFAEATKPLMQASGTSRGGDEAQDAWSQIDAKAKALREQKPELTIEQARVQVLSQNPELRIQYRAESRPVIGEE
jgi:hypothetical protein